MKILIYSPFFYPSIGGLETVVSILAHEFFYLGNEVKLISQFPSEVQDQFPFEVIRQPSLQKTLRLLQWSDVYFQPNVSLKGIWPLLVTFKPWVVSHNGWYSRSDNTYSWQDYLKQFAAYFATNISVSYAVSLHILSSSTVIPNPYQEEIFCQIPSIPRIKDLVFLGRLVSDKGVDLLLDALFELKKLGLKPKLTIVGKGPEELNLQQQSEALHLGEQVDFVGVKIGQELAQILNAHQILVVPSRWQEPFGVVALEGIACGCVVVGSEGGGLKEAIGPCGLTFPNGDLQSLTRILADLLNYPSKLSRYRLKAKQHLANHQKAEVAKAYLQVFERALK